MNNKVSLMMIALIVFGFSVLGYGLKQSQNAANQAHEGICAIKISYSDQIKSTKNYLVVHPNGAPTLGLSRKAIEHGLVQDEARLAVLRNVQCSR